MRKIMCEFFGGKRNGERIPIEEAEQLTADRTEDCTELRARGALCHRAELDNAPMFDGYCGPMWDGIRPDGTMIFRYESPEVYDLLSR